MINYKLRIKRHYEKLGYECFVTEDETIVKLGSAIVFFKKEGIERTLIITAEERYMLERYADKVKFWCESFEYVLEKEFEAALEEVRIS